MTPKCSLSALLLGPTECTALWPCVFHDNLSAYLTGAVAAGSAAADTLPCCTAQLMAPTGTAKPAADTAPSSCSCSAAVLNCSSAWYAAKAGSVAVSAAGRVRYLATSSNRGCPSSRCACTGMSGKTCYVVGWQGVAPAMMHAADRHLDAISQMWQPACMPACQRTCACCAAQLKH